jgi:hypothetical protein
MRIPLPVPRALLLALLVACVAPVEGQQAGGDAYLDEAARAIHRSAQENWQSIDESVVRYTATVRQRIAARLRTPLKDRTLYRNESAARVLWDRDHPPLVQVLGARARHPGREGGGIRGEMDFLDDLTIEGTFDPGSDRLAFGLSSEGDDDRVEEEDFWFAHPLAPGADTLYRYRSGDTLTLRLPDGRGLEVVKLDVLPRVADVHRISGSLWIEPGTGALVRAVYRLSDRFDAVRDVPDLREEDARGEFRWVPGLLKPWTFDMNMVAVDYALWDFRVWLPRAMRFEGEVAAGVLKMPVSFDLSYRIESVVTEDDLEDLAAAVPVVEEVHFETRAEAMAYMAELASRQGVAYRRYTPAAGSTRRSSRYLVPEDPSVLENSLELPPPIWDDAAGFQSEAELRALFDALADLPAPPVEGIPWAANWGFQRPDLVRYNRVEGPAVGGRFQARLGSFVGPLSFQATGFLGLADLEPKARLSLQHESLRRRVQVAGYRDIRAVDPRGRFLGFGNSLSALLFGRDDGEYFLSTGAELTVAPPSAEREGWRARLWAERQDPLQVETSFSLAHAFDGDWRFRPNLEAARVEELGAELTLTPWWGFDPLAPQFGFDLMLQGATFRPVGGGASDDWARARVVLRGAVPLAGGRWRTGIELAGGASWGGPPPQRQWILGGPLTMRGYPAAVAAGDTFGRGRLEVGRAFPAWSLSLFGDAGWAGERGTWDPDDALWAVGVGASLLDGLVRLDLSRGLTGPLRETRLDLYLDAIL